MKTFTAYLVKFDAAIVFSEDGEILTHTFRDPKGHERIPLCLIYEAFSQALELGPDDERKATA